MALSTINVLNNLNLAGNEMQNAVLQNLAAAPVNPKAGQMYYDTVKNQIMVHNGTAWEESGAKPVTGAVAGNLASLNAEGKIVDSGNKPADFIPVTQKGVANGVASLGADGKLPISLIPDGVIGTEEVVDLEVISDTAPAAPTNGMRYYAPTANLIYTWDGAAWGAGVAPVGDVIYVFDECVYHWSGTTMVKMTHKGGTFRGTNPALTGTGGLSTWSINHGLGQLHCHVTVRLSAAPYSEVMVASEPVDANNINIGILSDAVAAGLYTAMITA